MKKILSVIFVVIVLMFAVFLFTRDSSNNTDSNIADESTLESVSRKDFKWKFETEESSNVEAAKTKVTLNFQGKDYDAGRFDGSCSEIAAENLLPDEVSGVLCWFAGFGDEIGIFVEENQMILKHGEQSGGTEGEEGFRGNFVEVFTL